MSVSRKKSSREVSAVPQRKPRKPVALLRTGQVLERTGITHQVLYTYVTLGLIEAAATTPSGQRLFHPRVVTLIEVIQSLKLSGYSLRDMKDIFFKDERVRRAMASP